MHLADARVPNRRASLSDYCRIISTLNHSGNNSFTMAASIQFRRHYARLHVMQLVIVISALIVRTALGRQCEFYIPSSMPEDFEAHRGLLKWAADPVLAVKLAGDGGTIQCAAQADFCMVLWTIEPVEDLPIFPLYESGDPMDAVGAVMKGCWTSQPGACNAVGSNNDTDPENECIATRVTGRSDRPGAVNYAFCCCRADFCNRNFSYRPDLTVFGDDQKYPLFPENPFGRYPGRTYIYHLSISAALLCTFTLAAMAIGYAVWRYTCSRDAKSLKLDGKIKNCSTSDLDELIGPITVLGDAYILGTNLSPSDIDLSTLCLESAPIGHGRYGAVYKAVDKLNRPAAVKVYNNRDSVYFWNEINVLSSPVLREGSEFVVQFLGAMDNRSNGTGDGVASSMWLVMSLVPEGSLHDMLKARTVAFATAAKLGSDVAHALAFLHGELPDRSMVAIAHRDVNSRNVLVQRAESERQCNAILCDFGFALASRSDNENSNRQLPLPEVGTPRYMAPEVLDGSVNLRDSTGALKQIDVYGLALVLWELVSRCDDLHALVGIPVPAYSPPYSMELGAHPNVYQMHACVVRNRTRPRLPSALYSHANAYPALRAMRDVIEDCWDQDAEARLPALCAHERLNGLPDFHCSGPDAIDPSRGSSRMLLMPSECADAASTAAGGGGDQRQCSLDGANSHEHAANV